MGVMNPGSEPPPLPLKRLRRRLYLQVIALAAAAALVGVTALLLQYRTALQRELHHLAYVARSRAKLIEAVARFDAQFRADDIKRGGAAGTLSQLFPGRDRPEGWGQSGGIIIGRKLGDQLVLLIPHRRDSHLPRRTLWADHPTGPVKEALQGRSGSGRHRNRAGTQVLAAWEPVALPGMDLGLVARIDLAEIRAPFVRTGGMVALISLLLIGVFSITVRRLGEPAVVGALKAERKFRRLFEQSPLPLFETSLAGDILAVNKAGLRMTGSAWEDLEGKNVLDFYAEPKQREDFAARLRENGEVHGFEATLVDPDGSHLVCSLSSALTDGEKDEVPTIQTVAIDITERAKLQDERDWAARTHEALARVGGALIDPEATPGLAADLILDAAVILTGCEHGFVSSIDPATGANVGHTMTPMMESACLVDGEFRVIRLMPAEDGTYPSLWGHALNTGEGFFTNTPGIHRAAMGVPEGHIGLQNFLTVPSMVGEKAVGQIALANKSGGFADRDLEAVQQLAALYTTALIQRRNRDLLEESEGRFRNLFEWAPVPYQSLDEGGRFLAVNERWLDFFGYKKADLADKYFEDFVPPAEKASFQARFAQFLETGEITGMEFRVRAKGGKDRLVSLSGRVSHDRSGGFSRTHCLLFDVTEVKRLEAQLLEISERERKNAGEMLHETVGQEISGVAMFASALAKDLKDSGETGFAFEAGRIEELATQTAGRVRNLAHHLFPVHLKDFGFRTGLEALARQSSRYPDITLEVSPGGEEPNLSADTSIQLYRLVQEAVRNALRHSEGSTVRVSMEIRNGELTVVVEDDGRGFDPDAVREEGLGLGLMRHRATSLGASFSIVSQPGQGTRVECRLRYPGEDKGNG